MYIAVVQITRIYLGTPRCIVFPVQEGKGSLSSYLTADSSVRTMASSTWIELHPLPAIPMHRRMANCWSHWRRRAGQNGRERKRKICRYARASTFSPSDLFFRARARRDKGKDIFYRYRSDAISLLIETARGARNF